MQLRKQMLQADVSIDNNVYRNITADEELYYYKQKITRELMKLQANSFYNKQ